MRQGVRETKLVRFLTHAEKGEIGLVAGQAQTDAGVGPTGADSLRDPAMVMGMMHARARMSRLGLIEQLVEALLRARAGLAAYPAKLGTNGGPDRADIQARRSAIPSSQSATRSNR